MAVTCAQKTHANPLLILIGCNGAANAMIAELKWLRWKYHVVTYLWSMRMYLIKDEDGEIMRKAHRKEEAEQIIKNRAGWRYVYVNEPRKKPINFDDYEEAPF